MDLGQPGAYILVVTGRELQPSIACFCDRCIHNQPGKALNRALHKATGRSTLPGAVYISRASSPIGRSRRKQAGARPYRALYPQPGVLNNSNCG